MAHQIKGFFKKMAGEPVSYDMLAKQPIHDAEAKLALFRESTSTSIGGLENYLKYTAKSIDLQLADKFFESKELFKRHESKHDALLQPQVAHVMGAVLARLTDLQQDTHTDVAELVHSIEVKVLKPLNDYQREVAVVKENRRELKDAYDKIEQCRQSLDKARRDVEGAQRGTSSQTSRLTMIGTGGDTSKRMADLARLEDKVVRAEKELEEANALANERYDKYTESLYRRVSDECEMTATYLEYLKAQRRFHRQALKRLDAVIPNVRESIANYPKKPVFGCPLADYLAATNTSSSTQSRQPQQQQLLVSPVIRRLVEAMCKQNAFSEEGIFRVAGSRVKMNCLLFAINAGYLDYLDLAGDYDVHCLAGVLKQYVRELPDSLLCNELYEAWIGAINAPIANKIEAYKAVLHKLPKVNYDNIQFLIKFLAKVVENADKTKMTASNMGICFGVSLLSSGAGGNNISLNASQSAANTSGLYSKSSSSLSVDTLGTSATSSGGSGRLIDMSTATNVFDFLLTNHAELLPGDINFYSLASGTSTLTLTQQQQQQPSRTQHPVAAMRTMLPIGGQQLQNTPEPPASRGGGYQVNSRTHSDSHSSSSDGTASVTILPQQQPSMPQQPAGQFARSLTNTYTSNQAATAAMASPSASVVVSSSNHESTGMTHVHRHIKTNSLESTLAVGDNPTLMSENFSFVPAPNTGGTPTVTNTLVSVATAANASFSGKTASAGAAANAAAADAALSSPKMRAKKQAPAPPPTPREANLYPSLASASNETSRNAAFSSSSNTQLKRRTSNSSNGSAEQPSAPPSSMLPGATLSPITSVDRHHPTQNTPSPTSTNSSISGGCAANILEKPNQPPPTVPNRPPSIGFHVEELSEPMTASYIATISEHQQHTQQTPPPYPIGSGGSSNKYPFISNVYVSGATMSMPDNVPIVSEHLVGCSPSPNSGGTLGRHATKPAVPRKPEGFVSAQLSKLQGNGGSRNSDEFSTLSADSPLQNKPHESAKPTNEITSL